MHAAMVQHHYLNAVWLFALVASIVAAVVAIALPLLSRKLPRRR